MSVVTGLLVSVLILSRIGCPQPGFLASTTTTPFVVMNTAVLPPPLGPPGALLNTYKLSLSFSSTITLGPFCAAACGAPCRAVTTIDNAPIATSVHRTMLLLMLSSVRSEIRQTVAVTILWGEHVDE